ncbi:MAG: hypothetical protein AB7H88_08380 [Vicinamibacterales bacterium]
MAGLRGPGAVALALALGVPAASGQDYRPTLPSDHPAIAYLATRPDDPVGRLARRLASGEEALAPAADARGYLPQILARLGIAADTQMLVFSKTSFQARHISPDVPRAVFFGDEAAVAWVPGAGSLELTAVDPVLGSVFYEMTVDREGRPAFDRRPECLTCHVGPNTAGVPGIYVGSVIPGPSGAPLRDQSAIITDHRTPFIDRWGGWYVTATRGEQRDRANAVALNPAAPEELVRESRQNLPSLMGLVDLAPYPSHTSDIVALMTFEHQTQVTNLLTRVGWEARLAGAGEPAGGEGELARDIDELVAYMLFSGEAPIDAPIEGPSTFARTFAARGPRDPGGRSLRDFDLRTRLFRYPLSYMIYGAAFDALPTAARNQVYRRLFEVLSGADDGPAFAHLTAADRRAILEILRATKPGLPDYWSR